MDKSEIEEMLAEVQENEYNEAVDDFISGQGVSTFYVQEDSSEES